MLSFSYLPVYLWTIQLLEYQTDMRRCRFDTLGKLTPAHRAGAPIACGRWVCPRAVGESDCPIVRHSIRSNHRSGALYTAPERWVDVLQLNPINPFSVSFGIFRCASIS